MAYGKVNNMTSHLSATASVCFWMFYRTDFNILPPGIRMEYVFLKILYHAEATVLWFKLACGLAPHSHSLTSQWDRGENLKKQTNNNNNKNPKQLSRDRELKLFTELEKRKRKVFIIIYIYINVYNK